MGGSGGECPPNSPGHPGGRLICQPTLVSNFTIPSTIEKIPTEKSAYGSPLVGFDVVVALINKNEVTPQQSAENSPIQGFIQKLLGGRNATPQVAPHLPDLLRQIGGEEGRKIQNSTINDFLQRNQSVKRYDSAFRLLWATLQFQKIHPPDASPDDLANTIIQIFRVSPAQARNAYSACLLLPGVGGGLRFHPLLSTYKKMWNTSNEKYGAFYDAFPILLHLKETSMEALMRPENLQLLRNQFILASRFAVSLPLN